MKHDWPEIVPSPDAPRARPKTTRVLIETDMPELVVAEQDGGLFLGVLSEVNRANGCRWVYSPVSREELRQVLSGAIDVLECFGKAKVLVVDERDDGESAVLVDGAKIPLDALPNAGFRLPEWARPEVGSEAGVAKAVYITRDPVIGDRGADAEVAGTMLLYYAKLANARSRQRMRSRERSRNRRTGASPRPVRPFRMMVTNALHGSFGFEVEDVGGPIDEPVDSAVLDDVTSILQRVFGAEEDFGEALGELDKYGRAALKALIVGLSDAKAGLRFGRPDTRDMADPPEEITPEEVTRAAGRISRTRVQSEHVVAKPGILRGVLRRPRNYEFLPGAGSQVLAADPIFGRVDSSLDDTDIFALQALQNTRVTAFFHVVTIHKVGTPKSVFTLIGVDNGDGTVIGRTATEPDPGDETSGDDIEPDLSSDE